MERFFCVHFTLNELKKNEIVIHNVFFTRHFFFVIVPSMTSNPKSKEANMTKIYFRDSNDKKVEIEVCDKVAKTMRDCRREEWRNDAKERYYRGRTLSTLTDDAIEFRQDKPERNLMVNSPEERLIAEEERKELRIGLKKRLETLTERQKQIVSLLYKGFTITEIAKLLNVTKQSIYDIRKAIQNKFEDFLK